MKQVLKLHRLFLGCSSTPAKNAVYCCSFQEDSDLSYQCLSVMNFHKGVTVLSINGENRADLGFQNLHCCK